MDVDGLASPARVRPRGPEGAGRCAAKSERRGIMNSRRGLYITLFGLFLASGFCGLLYQVVWLRLAFAAFGVITPVLSIVLSVFMLGLSLGSWAGGRWIDELTLRSGRSAAWSLRRNRASDRNRRPAGSFHLLGGPSGAAAGGRDGFDPLPVSLGPGAGHFHPALVHPDGVHVPVHDGLHPRSRRRQQDQFQLSVPGQRDRRNARHGRHGGGADRNARAAPHVLGRRRAEFRRRRSQRETRRHESRSSPSGDGRGTLRRRLCRTFAADRLHPLRHRLHLPRDGSSLDARVHAGASHDDLLLRVAARGIPTRHVVRLAAVSPAPGTRRHAPDLGVDRDHVGLRLPAHPIERSAVLNVAPCTDHTDAAKHRPVLPYASAT